MRIRREQPQDAEAVRTVHRRCFGGDDDPNVNPPEVGLVDALRAEGSLEPRCCFVADAGGRVVGHMACSIGHIDGHPEARVLGLAPIGVLPEWRREGIGGALVNVAVGAADALGYEAVVLLGRAMYYQKFGFVPAEELGVRAPDASWPAANFQIRPLSDHTGVRGTFRYAPAFDRL